MKSSLEIAQEAVLQPIEAIASEAGLEPDEVEPYGRYKAKVELSVLDRLKTTQDGKLICVTGMTPTKAGEGKTTTLVGLTQGLGVIGKDPVACLRIRVFTSIGDPVVERNFPEDPHGRHIRLCKVPGHRLIHLGGLDEVYVTNLRGVIAVFGHRLQLRDDTGTSLQHRDWVYIAAVVKQLRHADLLAENS